MVESGALPPPVALRRGRGNPCTPSVPAYRTCSCQGHRAPHRSPNVSSGRGFMSRHLLVLIGRGAGQYLVSGSEFDRAAKYRKSVYEQDTAERSLSGRKRSGLRGQLRGDGTHVPRSANQPRQVPCDAACWLICKWCLIRIFVSNSAGVSSGISRKRRLGRNPVRRAWRSG
jgi:hypothetical protein